MVITYYNKRIRKVANKQNNISVSLPLLQAENKECSEYIFFKKFSFDINLPNYLFIWIVLHCSGLFLVFLRL